jgi:hypothetical protein
MYKDGSCSFDKDLSKKKLTITDVLTSFVAAVFELLCPRVLIVYLCIVALGGVQSIVYMCVNVKYRLVRGGGFLQDLPLFVTAASLKT